MTLDIRETHFELGSRCQAPHPVGLLWSGRWGTVPRHSEGLPSQAPMAFLSVSTWRLSPKSWTFIQPPWDRGPAALRGGTGNTDVVPSLLSLRGPTVSTFCLEFLRHLCWTKQKICTAMASSITPSLFVPDFRSPLLSHWCFSYQMNHYVSSPCPKPGF